MVYGGGIAICFCNFSGIYHPASAVACTYILISLPGTLCKFEAEILVLMFIDIARSRLKLGYLQTLQSSNQYESKESGVLK